mgnify:CR=1 FL=1
MSNKKLSLGNINFDVFNEICDINYGLSMYEWDKQFPIIVHSEEEYQDWIKKGWGYKTFIKKYK